MSDLGKLTYYLGIEVTQGADGIRIKQRGYVQGILVKTKMESCNYTHVPMHTSLKISKAEEEPEIDATSYQSTIGCLKYLLYTQSDLAFSVGVLSRYMQSPRESHGKAVKHLLGYIKGTTKHGLFFKLNGTTKITCYNHNSHSIDIDDGRSTTRFMFYLGT
ncbi:PREDICTED: uncharacterized mitochondrial protein AtMg00810-like [Brassica oleracea var. oleracea]|uniref:uncharacterized mitochondrial protein AtMg00810-like n=1 Tax=Brassica oleracea var. oleracea TaxID=109376 RepID=UPI0006A6BAC3|nr:PREDICTED: uncharacterized mitochondrial protein AtMg00810-like [Brassica oleracea var. oleracea]